MSKSRKRNSVNNHYTQRNRTYNHNDRQQINHKRSNKTKREIINNQLERNNDKYISNSRLCNLCNKYHPIQICRKFLSMNVKAREKFIDRHRYCVNCLARSHDGRACPSMNRCKKCDAFHHTILHPHRQPITTKQLRERNRKPKHSPAISNQPITTSATSSTVVISEAIKSLAAILCASK